MDNIDLEINFVPYEQLVSETDFDLDGIIYSFDNQIEILSCHTATFDF